MTELSASTRANMIDDIVGEELDVLVIGGGITGVGAAVDAAVRGLRVGLVEQADFASGTSSRSSKMIHGGLRYLATGDIKLVREALRERALIASRAPHLVRPLPMMLPIYGRRIPWLRAKLEMGLLIYDLLGARRGYGWHKWLNVREVLGRLPNLDPSTLLGGLAYHDAQADDVSLVLSNVRTAAQHGARVVNRARVCSLIERDGRIAGARVSFDGGDEVEVLAKVVVNTTGVWADKLFAEIDSSLGFALQPSKGIHLTVRRDRVGIDSGIAFFSQTGNSNIFIEPWDEELAFVGTSDTPYRGDLADPVATEEEIALLLTEINRFLRTPLMRDDVIATWAGLRPLVVKVDAQGKVAAGNTKDVSRAHATVVSPGLVSMVGGKLTTYRHMAEDVIDAAARQLDRPVAACSTHLVPLDGAGPARQKWTVDAIVEHLNVDRAVARHLARRHGSNVATIVELCDDDASLRARLHPDRPYIRAEVIWAARYEMALSVDDVIHRRTRLGIETRDSGGTVADDIAQLLADAGVTPLPGDDGDAVRARQTV
ncbi:MAG: glycerol-3-phosphate dehydrogenase/oxidase [Thermoleophilia bacterium]|nr:glycerol-3-phosphate dehydrogenase/oxidase [Thermoleophilia bacterium]